jgi:PAS domain S-box-containing protein
MNASLKSAVEKDYSQMLFEENFSKVLLDLKDYAIAVIDTLGTVMSWNVGAEHIYGFSAAEVLSKHFSNIYDEQELQNIQPWIDLQVVQENGRYEREGWEYKKGGARFYTNTIVTALYDRNKSVKGFAKVTRDITIQKNLQDENKVLAEQLEEKVQQRTSELAVVVSELEAFSYSVSHDLRAPLRAVSGYSMMLKEDYELQLDAEANRIINVIVDNTKMMSQLIDDLLTFSKMARLEAVNANIDMTDLAERCVADFLKQEKSTDFTITILPMSECKGDANMLKQVWFNLISNAFKYSAKKANPRIEVGSKDDDSYNIYYVRDNGAGFDMKYYNKLFCVFQRLHRNDEFEGTGLGLALIKRIVSKHRGDVWAEAAINVGATFYFSVLK